MSRFPAYRPRRLRRREALRRLVRETHVVAEQLVQPLFVVPGTKVETPVGSMPGVAQLSVDRAAEESRRLVDLGVPAVLLFGACECRQERRAERVFSWVDVHVRAPVGRSLARPSIVQ